MQFSYTRKTPQLQNALNFSYLEELIFGQESIRKFSVQKENYQAGITVRKLGMITKYILQI